MKTAMKVFVNASLILIGLCLLARLCPRGGLAARQEEPVRQSIDRSVNQIADATFEAGCYAGWSVSQRNMSRADLDTVIAMYTSGSSADQIISWIKSHEQPSTP